MHVRYAIIAHETILNGPRTVPPVSCWPLKKERLKVNLTVQSEKVEEKRGCMVHVRPMSDTSLQRRYFEDMCGGSIRDKETFGRFDTRTECYPERHPHRQTYKRR